jgi:hypothetical protein
MISITNEIIKDIGSLYMRRALLVLSSDTSETIKTILVGYKWTTEEIIMANTITYWDIMIQLLEDTRINTIFLVFNGNHYFYNELQSIMYQTRHDINIFAILDIKRIVDLAYNVRLSDRSERHEHSSRHNLKNPKYDLKYTMDNLTEGNIVILSGNQSNIIEVFIKVINETGKNTSYDKLLYNSNIQLSFGNTLNLLYSPLIII